MNLHAQRRKFINPLTSNPYCTESLPCAEGLDGAAAEHNKRFFPKITARLFFKIKVNFSLLFLSMVIFYHASVGNVKKYMSSYVIAKMKFFIYLRI